ncbi:choice-of-anchor M domain-containing protein [Streptomyces shenzhenensis]|uniref:choice-of-anchor M domain-containing protein n=1 Tax=Streptomyces shenzhenensis TaxID=943815 RepID=UPI003407566F
MASARNSRGAAAGALGSVVLAATLSPAAFAGTSDDGTRALPGPAPQVVVALDADALSLRLKNGTGTRSSPADEPAVDLELGSDTETVVPAGEEYAFLGRPGDPIWVLDGAATGLGTTPAGPQWDTTGVSADQLADGDVEWAFTGIEGPGDAVVFAPPRDATADAATTAPHVLFDSADGFPDAQPLPAADTGEVAWAFTRPGTYRLTSQATAHLANGGTTTATQQWTVRVATDNASQSPVSTAPSPVPTEVEHSGEGSGSVRKSDGRSSSAAARSATSTGVATQRVVIDDGHVDAIAGKMVDGKLRALFKDSRDPGDIIWREPSSVVVHVRPQAKEKVPSSSGYAFLGEPGSDFWLIPQVQKQGVVWAGWNTEALGSGDLKGPIDMKLTKVSGPGPLAVWETAGLGGAQVLYNSADGLPDSRRVDLGVHAHANWGFGKQGVYKLTFQLSGMLPTGTTTTDTRTYTFAVGDVDVSEVTPGGGSGDGGSTAGTGGSTGGVDKGGSSNGSASNGSGSPSSGSGSGSGGSLAHTGSGPAQALALGAGALVLGGAAAVGASGAARRRTAAAASRGDVQS